VAAMSDDLVNLRGLFAQSEVNARGVSYLVNKWGVVTVPVEDIGPLMKVGGFSIADENTEGVATATLEDVAEVAWHLPLGVARSTLLAILRSPNSMAHPIQSIAFS
jgi:hypothetical protein